MANPRSHLPAFYACFWLLSSLAFFRALMVALLSVRGDVPIRTADGEETLPADRQSVDLYQLIGDALNAARMQVNLATLWYQEGRVDALLDEGKFVEAGAVLGQVDGMLKELDPPPEWLLREVEVQVARLAAVTQQGTG